MITLKNNGKIKTAAYTVKGFTLVEILVAIFILGLVMTTVYTAFNTVVGRTEAIESGSEIYQMAKNCLNLMSDDLRSMYVTPKKIYKEPEVGDDPEQFRLLCEQSYVEADAFFKLSFSSFNHMAFSASVRAAGICQIVYYVDKSDFGDYVLRRYDMLYPHEPFEETSKEPVICEKIKSVKYTFYDEEGEEYETWDSDTDDVDYATPTSVTIRLELGNDENTYVFSTRVKLPICRKKS